ncbi:hypothetical protein [Paenibacillus sp. XY044]|uniref:hypothetical protein n=1 Tax=Paenibacillus sp. XY044 TaxID=2026089 RepID=UPI000B991E43|nr:hypothetical protein [Paenibacillus sp. XY044]OZB96547.1 hypothetical protein CJP46_11765 [Paenibacillus sp. XY044]
MTHTFKTYTLEQAVGSLIAAFDKIGYSEPLEVASIIIEFEDFLNQLSTEEAVNIYNERWMNGGN